jgi:(1->4)-alpha-D-glucan 1-alpha-D-glucosylmutase
LRVPRATYRLQLNGEFTFADAAELVPYLAELGVSDLYSSPYFAARPGSTHGYDVTDPNTLNPEIGGREEHARMVGALHARGMGHLLDIVPNHMGVGPDNGRWMSVLESGPASPEAHFFDIDWYPTNRRELWGKMLLPILGDHYRAVLEGGDLKLSFEAPEGSFSVLYYEHRLPLDPRTYPMVLGDLSGLPRDERALELQSLADAFGNLPERGATEDVEARARDAEIYRGWLARLCREAPAIARTIEEQVERVNGDPGAPETFELLHQVLEAQAYRLVYWRVASDEINYRRFFAINDLAGVRVEDERVFGATHRLVLDLVREGKVDGLRIDHPDGLYDPAGYLRRLQSAAGAVLGRPLGRPGEEEPLYVLVEKILAHHERLPEDWLVAGTTGYDFLNLLNGLFVRTGGEAGMDRTYRRFIGRSVEFEEVIYDSKQLIMRGDLASELNVLTRRLLRLSEYGRRSYDFTINALRDALREVVAYFPVYRTYIADGEVSEADERYVEWAVALAKKHGATADDTVYDFVRDALLLRLEGPEEYRRMVEGFVGKFQQYTGPVMAKGMEDTALYRYNRLASLNEVGGEPERFGVSVAAFHHLSVERQRRWPHAMLATSTHDTKRGEDVRARIDALSEMPGEWRSRLVRWGRMNRSRRRDADGVTAPSRDDEYLLYQTLVGAWPLDEMDGEALASFRERIKAYMEKAMREAQVHTSWVNVNREYEEGVAAFVDALLSPEHNIFLEDLVSFARRIARLGALSSLSQTLIKLTAPGVPDVYQGNELWDLSLVDPDNRRPVDYPLRRRMLADLKKSAGDAGYVRSMLEEGTWQDGWPKLLMTWRALELRRGQSKLFEEGEYVPLEAEGERTDHLVAFARRRREEFAIAIAPRLYARLADEERLLFRTGVWENTRIRLPEELAASGLRNILTGENARMEKDAGGRFLLAAELLRSFPVALLATESCR